MDLIDPLELRGWKQPSTSGHALNLSAKMTALFNDFEYWRKVTYHDIDTFLHPSSLKAQSYKTKKKTKLSSQKSFQSILKALNC